MKILFTADLHLDIPARHPRTGRTAFEDFEAAIESNRPDAVVVAGDIGSLYRAEEYLPRLRVAAGDVPLAITLGNHDCWLDSSGHGEFPTLEEIVNCFWRPEARFFKITLLDVENLNLGGVTIVGGYGHFDLGLAEPELTIGGTRVTEDVYLSGGMGGLFWNDFCYIPNCAASLKAEARIQAEGIGRRLNEADSSRLIVVTHTCPWRELNGHPLRGNEQDILLAYSGNSLVGEVLEMESKRIEIAVCGHTHRPVREREIHGVRSLNIGADYGVFRGILYDTCTRRIEWIGEPF